MRIYIGLFFSVLAFLTACSGDDAPPGIIKQQEMIALLTEVHITDGSMYTVQQYPDTLYKYGTGKYLAVFNKYRTDSATFRKSFKYYTTKPELLMTMYDEVMKQLKFKNDSITKTAVHALPQK